MQLITVLSTCEEAESSIFLERATKLSRGNLSVQLTRLEEANVIEIEKRIEHKRYLSRPRDSLIAADTYFTAYWESMLVLRKAAE